MAKTTGQRYIADALRAYGVDHVFFVPQMLLETLTAMEGMGIRRVMVHGEKAAAYMADGYARASRRPQAEGPSIPIGNAANSTARKKTPRSRRWRCVCRTSTNLSLPR